MIFHIVTRSSEWFKIKSKSTRENVRLRSINERIEFTKNMVNVRQKRERFENGENLLHEIFGT